MEHVDLLYSGLVLTALMLSLWTAVLATAACIFFAPSVLNRIPVPSTLAPGTNGPTGTRSLEAHGS